MKPQHAVLRTGVVGVPLKMQRSTSHDIQDSGIQK